MNLVIVNKNINVINSLNIDIIKTLHGEFSADDLKSELVNFYFNRVIIDITAIKNFIVSSNLFDVLNYFGKDKVILLLDDNDYCNDNKFISDLINNGFYNFTKNAQGISYLIDRSNTYDDVKKYLKTDTFSSVLTENSSTTNSINQTDQSIYGVTNNNINQMEQQTNSAKSNNKQIIIGVQNLSEGAGATTLMSQMVKQLSLNYNVKGIEINGHDSLYFRNPNIFYYIDYLETKLNIEKKLKDIQVIIIDLNYFEDKDHLCDDIIYLLEPGIIRLSKCINNISYFMEKIEGKKIVLNRSALQDDEINYFERQTGIKVFYNLINFDERKERLLSVDKLLIKLGFDKQEKK